MVTSKIKQSILFLITASIVLFLLYSYFFVYVKEKEEYVNQRNYKVLVRISKNLESKIEEYRTKDVTKNLLDNSLNSSNCQNDSLEKKLKCAIKNEPINRLLNLTLDSIKAGEKSKGDTLHHQDSPWKLIFIDTIRYKKRHYVTYTSISADKFIEPELRRDIFSEYLILETDSVHGCAEIYSTTSLGLNDSLKKKFIQKCPDEIVLNGITYKAFCHATTFDNEPCVVIGLQDKAQYAAETQGLERPVLYTTIFITILLLLAIPLIKVILISKNEKLNKADVILCGVSLLFGCFLCTLLVISLGDKQLYDHRELEILADSIEHEFKGEVDSAFAELIAADTILRSNPFDRTDLLKTATNEKNSTDKLKYEPRFKKFQNILWADYSGKQQFRWTVLNKNRSKIDISDRQYFRAIVDGTAWQNSSYTDSYFLESIRSWNTSERLGAISKKSVATNDLSVAAIICYLPSVIAASVPLGYKFCIANQQGEVLFHSDVRRNLNENIFDELNLKNNIQDILYGHVKKEEAIYENKPHKIYLVPMKDIPLYLVTMKDLTLDIEAKTFTLEITFFFLALQVLTILLAILSLRVTRPRNPWYRVHKADLEWLKPDDDQRSLYLKTTLVNGVIFLLSVSFFIVLSPVEQIFSHLVIPLYIIPCYFLNMNRKYNNKPLRVWDKANRPSIITIAALILMGNIVFFVATGFHASLIILQALLLIPVIDFNYPFSTKRMDEISTRTLYGLSLATLLFLIGIVPTVNFYRHAFNHERILHEMSVQYDLAKKNDLPSPPAKVFNNKLYTIDTKLYTGPTENGRDQAGRLNGSLLSDPGFLQLWQISNAVRGTIGKEFLVRKENFYVYAKDLPGTWKREADTLLFKESAGNKKSGLLIQSSIRHFKFPWPGESPAFWPVALLGLTYLLVFTRFLVARIFIFDKNKRLIEADLHLLMKNETPFLDDMKTERENIKNHLFVIGLPFSGKREYLDKLYPPDNTRRHSIDLILLHVNNQWQTILRDADQEAIDVIIIDHFEYDFENKDINNNKLVLLEKLFLLKGKKIVIVSTIHPQQMLESYKKGDPPPELERWISVLSHFYELYYKLKINVDTSYALANPEKRDTHKELYNFVELECSHGLFMQNLKPTMYALIESSKDKLSIKELSDKIGNLAGAYYTSLWSTCSRDERFLIYDLAEDGLVNSKNADSITRLLYKGIFTRDNTLSLMNTSFRSFVLSYIVPEQQIAFRMEAARVGSWSRIRGPIFTMLGLTALFLLYTQKGLSAQVTGFFGALGTIIPILFRILESMSQSKSARNA